MSATRPPEPPAQGTWVIIILLAAALYGMLQSIAHGAPALTERPYVRGVLQMGVAEVLPWVPRDLVPRLELGTRPIHIVHRPQQWMNDRAFGSLGPQPGQVLGGVSEDGSTIYVTDAVSPYSDKFRIIVVHELVHIFRTRTGAEDLSCLPREELLAYTVQSYYERKIWGAAHPGTLFHRFLSDQAARHLCGL